VNQLSRLVIDPERFTDDREELNSKGMGAVYTKTSAGLPLRHHADQTLLRDYFDPYAAALADLVDDRLDVTGRAVILDIHSYPAEALAYELHPEAARPEVCLGIDPDHTPPLLQEAARKAFDGWEVAINEPFTGTYVPLRHHGRDRRVLSIMIELRRDVLTERFTETASRLAELIHGA
jgi:N-formylglutamate deformylase